MVFCTQRGPWSRFLQITGFGKEFGMLLFHILSCSCVCYGFLGDEGAVRQQNEKLFLVASCTNSLVNMIRRSIMLIHFVWFFVLLRLNSPHFNYNFNSNGSLQKFVVIGSLCFFGLDYVYLCLKLKRVTTNFCCYWFFVFFRLNPLMVFCTPGCPWSWFEQITGFGKEFCMLLFMNVLHILSCSCVYYGF